MTIKEAVAHALNVQDACNLSGVVYSWSRILNALVAIPSLDDGEYGDGEWNKLGTDARNTHCINVLFADKVAHLTGTQTVGVDKVAAAYKQAYEIIGGA